MFCQNKVITSYGCLSEHGIFILSRGGCEEDMVFKQNTLKIDKNPSEFPKYSSEKTHIYCKRQNTRTSDKCKITKIF